MNRNQIVIISVALAAGVIGNLAYEWWASGTIRGEVVVGVVFAVLVMTCVLALISRRAQRQD